MGAPRNWRVVWLAEGMMKLPIPPPWFSSWFYYCDWIQILRQMKVRSIKVGRLKSCWKVPACIQLPLRVSSDWAPKLPHTGCHSLTPQEPWFRLLLVLMEGFVSYIRLTLTIWRVMELPGSQETWTRWLWVAAWHEGGACIFVFVGVYIYNGSTSAFWNVCGCTYVVVCVLGCL